MSLALTSTQYGTQTNLESLATVTVPPAQFGEEQLTLAVRAFIDAHNASMNEKLDLLVEDTTETQLSYSGTTTMEMEAVDEIGRVDVQRIAPVIANAGFPLRTFQIALGWTRRHMQNSSVQWIVNQILSARDADIRNMDRRIMIAFFNPTNYTFIDRETNNVALPVKALLNADGAMIPTGINATPFNGATHTHFLTSATLTEASVQNLLNTVTEHYDIGMPVIYINQAQEATFKAFTSASFQAYVPLGIRQPDTALYATGRNLDLRNSYNRAIGVFNGAEVWVKPWVPAGYVLCILIGAPKPLARRLSATNPDAGNFQLVYQDEDYPLRAQTFERQFGIAVWNRPNGAVLQITGGGVYTSPTF